MRRGLTVEQLVAIIGSRDPQAAADLRSATPAVQAKVVAAYRECPDVGGRRFHEIGTRPPTPGSRKYPYGR